MFEERLNLDLTLTIKGTAYAIPGGNVKRFRLDLEAWGFTGELEFVKSDDQQAGGGEKDTLAAAFIQPDLIQVSLDFIAAHPAPETVDSMQPTAVKGLVYERAMEELAYMQTVTDAVLTRRYKVRFADPAWVLWRQHYPCELFVSQSFQQVLDAYKGENIALTYNWDTLTAQKPLLFIGLDPTVGASSFYDLLCWYLWDNEGVFTYSYTDQGYTVAGTRDSTGTPAGMFGDDVRTVRVQFPPVIRYNVNVLNSYTEGAQIKAITQDQAVTGIRQDILLDTGLSGDVDTRVTLETNRLKVRQSELEVLFRRFPTIDFWPGLLVTFSPDALWSSAAYQVGKTWRVFQLVIDARAADPGVDDEHDLPGAPFVVELVGRLEQSTETYIRVPPFLMPDYPRTLEGKVVSTIGAEEEETYEIFQDATTSQDQYKVSIPLWSDQQGNSLQIAVPYYAHLGMGHYYFPAYKNARVLVALYFDHGELLRFLDWRAGARLPADTQGDNLMVGKSQTNSTSVRHVYDSDSNPVFSIIRTHDKDTALFQMSEGDLLIRVQEDSSS